jgi:hypothetical protein
MRGFCGVLAGSILALASSGCLQKETTHTLYLSPAGEVHWQIHESGVRSDEAEDVKRLEEERAYILPALVGAHRVARGLQALEPDGVVQTTIVREAPPFHVITAARYSRIDRAFGRLFTACGIDASVTLTNDDDVTRLHMRFDFRKAIEHTDTPVLALLEDLGDFRFVLTEGRFIAGGGFDVPDRTRAVLSREALTSLTTAMDARQQIELVLAWTR